MKNYQLLNGSNLAYIGDAYYELKVREYLINKGITKSKELRKVSIDFVSASAHQKIYEEIKDEFTEEENKAVDKYIKEHSIEPKDNFYDYYKEEEKNND